MYLRHVSPARARRPAGVEAPLGCPAGGGSLRWASAWWPGGGDEVDGSDGLDHAGRPGAGERARRSVVRQRRANVAGGRRGGHRVLVTLDEEEQLARLAAAQGVTVPRLLVESALAQRGETATQRRDALVELLAVRRLLTAVSVNVNQVAAKANATSRMPAETAGALSAVRRLVARIDDVLDQLDSRV